MYAKKRVTSCDYEQYNEWFSEETWSYDPDNDKIGDDLVEEEHYRLIDNLLEQGFEWVDVHTLYNPETDKYVYGA